MLLNQAGIPFYGSYTEVDPAIIAGDGVDMFKKEGNTQLFWCSLFNRTKVSFV